MPFLKAGKELFRRFLSLIPPTATVRILRGPLRGKRWLKGSGVNGYWLGTYEPAEQEAFVRAISPGDVVFDVGAHVGFYTLLAAELAGERGRVFAFEPCPGNLHYLRAHVAMNRYRNVRIVAAAVLAKGGSAVFSRGLSNSTGKVERTGAGIPIAAVSLDELVEGGAVAPPSFVKIDVEGTEVEVLRGARAFLARRHPTVLVATHGEGLRRAVYDMLTSIGYRVEPLGECKDAVSLLATLPS